MFTAHSGHNLVAKSSSGRPEALDFVLKVRDLDLNPVPAAGHGLAAVRHRLRCSAWSRRRGGFNRWTINGKSWPDTDPLVVERGKRYRLVFNNDSGDMHPMHLHRHTFELVHFAGKPTSGIRKDLVNVPRRQTVEVDFVADDPGLSLFHCHMQEHQDFGFMALVKYA